MKIGGLFSGAGMLETAALTLFPGSEVRWHSEIESAACKVLDARFPGVLNLGDITEIDWAEVEPVDILTGGFPCQDVSVAGRRSGLSAGTRSGLWSHMRTAVEVLRPKLVMIENVRGLLSARAIRGMGSAGDGVGKDQPPDLRALGAVLGDLADIGYDATWTCLQASDVGAAHRRNRVFILAHPADSAGDGRNQGRTEPARIQW